MPPTTNLPTFDTRIARRAPDESLCLEPSDGELLMRFVRHRDQSAFADLVTKHATLVWNVCWQILRRHHDVEDAFQATFLILARRAKTVRSCESLSGWLYRVAYRTALKARMGASSRVTAELPEELVVDGVSSLERIQEDEHRGVLLEELQSLPLQYQEPLVLCYLAGNSRCQVAEELSLTTQAVKGRLARGKQLLRQRLIRRGVSLSIAMALVQATARTAEAALVPSATDGLASSLSLKNLPSTGSTVSSQALQLAEQGIRIMQIIGATKYALATALMVSTLTLGLAVAGDEEGNSVSADATAGIVLETTTNDAADNEVADQTEILVEEVRVAHEKAPQAPRAPKAVILKALKKPAAVSIPAPVAVVQHEIQMQNSDRVYVTRPSQFAGPHRPDVAADEYRISPDMAQTQAKLAEKQAEILELQIQAKQAEIRALQENTEKQRVEFERHAKRMLAEAELAQLEARRMEQKQKARKFEFHIQTDGQSKTFPNERDGLEVQVRALTEALAQIKASEQKLQTELDSIRQQLEKKSSPRPAGQIIPDQLPEINPRKPTGSAPSASNNTPGPMPSPTDPGPAAQYVDAPALVASNRYDPNAVSNWPGQESQSPRTELQIGDVLRIEVIGAFPEHPIDGAYRIEPMGTIALGATYGRVKVAGMNILDAEERLKEHLSEMFADVSVQITMDEPQR